MDAHEGNEGEPHDHREAGRDRRHDRYDDELVAIMGRLATGDDAAVVTLYERYGGPIAAAVQRVARGRRGRIERDDLDGLVFEVCFELAHVAGAWSPEGGALPWVWARHRVANVVDRVLGQWALPLGHDLPADGDDPREAGWSAGRAVEAWGIAGTAGVAVPEGASLVTALERLGPNLDSARLLAEALDVGRISPRDRELWLEYAYEKQSGNRSPAATVAPGFGMNEDTVRQAARRARQRVRSLAARDERFAPLATLPLLA